MRTVTVRYRVKLERVEEHQGLVRRVFDELAKTQPPGLRYGAFRLEDGVTFVHFAWIEAAENPLQKLESFKAFVANIADRCDEPPATSTLTAIGTYALPGGGNPSSS
jgi:hypothetical protein